MRTTHRPLGYRCRQEQWAPSLYYRRSVAHRDRYLVRLSDFFRSRLAVGHSRSVTARLDLATLSSVLLVSLAFSLCPYGSWFIRTLVIAPASSELDIEWGINRDSGDEGLLDNR